MPSDPDPIFFNVRSPEINFVRKSNILTSIKDTLNTSNIIVISGLGGVGKTQLARKFIQEYRSSYKNVVWINSGKSGSINDSFKQLASDAMNIPITNCNKQLKDPSVIISQVLNKLSKSKTLCVYDNVDKIENISFVLTIEPSGIKPHVIITSRILEWDDNFEVKQLKVWESDEALTYVSMTLKDHKDEDDQKLLVKKLQCFPLALRQSTSFINYQRRERPFRIADYINKFEASYQDTKELLDNKTFKKAATNTYEETTLTTWRITVDAIKEDGERGASASRIFNIMAYCDPENIHRDIFIHLTGTSENREEKQRAENIRSAVRLLINYSMVDSQESQSVLNVHRLVQLVTKLDLRVTQQEETILRDALKLISKLIEVKDATLKVSHLHLISVFLSALDFVDQCGPSFNYVVQEVSELPNEISKTLFALGKYNEANDFVKNTSEPLKLIFQGDQLANLKTLHNLAVSYHYLGKHTDAIKIFEEVLKEEGLILCEDHPETFVTIQCLANSYAQLGKHSDAIQILEEVLVKMKSILGEDHELTLATIQCLANSYQNQGKNSEAIQMLEECLKKTKLTLGENNRQTLNTIHTLAISYQNQGKHSEAIQMLEEGLVKMKLILGEDHPETLTTMHCLAISYAKLENHSEAIQILEEVWEKRKSILGEYHQITLITIFNIAFSYAKLGNHSHAIQIYEEVLEKQMVTLGEDHPATLETRNYLAYSYAKIGRYSEAIPIFEAILEKQKVTLGEDHLATLGTGHNLARSYGELGNNSAAIQIYEEVVEKLRMTVGEDHPLTLRATHYLACSYAELKKHSDAIQNYSVVENLNLD